MAGGPPRCLGWAMTPAALLTSSSHRTATPPSPALDLTGGSPNLDLGRGLCWERRGFGDQGCPPTPASPQASVLARPLPGCRRSKPLPFTSLGFFLCGVRPAWGADRMWPFQEAHEEEMGIAEPVGWGLGRSLQAPQGGRGMLQGPPSLPQVNLAGKLSLGLRVEPGWESRCQTRGQGQRSSGRPSAAGGTGRGRRQGGPGRRLHPRLPRPLTQPGQVPSPPRGHSLARPPVIPAAAFLAYPGAVPSVPACLRSLRLGNLPELRPPPAEKDKTEASHGSRCPPPELSLRLPVIPGSECALITALPPWPLPGVPALIGAPSKASQTPHSQQFSGKPGPPSPCAPLSHPEPPCM